jgi:hypothetical protein
VDVDCVGVVNNQQVKRLTTLATWVRCRRYCGRYVIPAARICRREGGRWPCKATLADVQGSAPTPLSAQGGRLANATNSHDPLSALFTEVR